MKLVPLSAVLLALSAPALALATPVTDAGVSDGGSAYETTIAEPRVDVPEGRATSGVRRGELDRRQPRSMPDALREEPGVFVQQTAHGQASAYVRGLTGQQTVLLFDGIRLNTSTWRQGPNQYGVTLDVASLGSLEVLRSGGATRFGSDALGGVIAAQPLEASPVDGVRPSLVLRGATADQQRGARAGLEAVHGPVAFIGGAGLREAGLLESAGSVQGLAQGQPLPAVPRFAPDGRTQLGTGFKEMTADGRLTWRPTPRHDVTVAAQLFRQYDAPRTDQCPPANGQPGDCLTVREQVRGLAYAAWTARPEALESARATLSWQRQHEAREGARPSAGLLTTDRDTVDTLGATATVAVRPVTFGFAALRLRGGVDSYVDLVQSGTVVAATAAGTAQASLRGQYLSGSRALTGGAFGEAHLALGEQLHLRGGARLGWVSVFAPGDEASRSLAVQRQWWPLAGNAGLEWRPRAPLALFANVDHSFRAPNLDDLTARQRAGSGFQLENPALTPERATTVEVGARLRLDWLSVEAWGFQTWLAGAVGGQPGEASACPPATPACARAPAWFRLANAPGVAQLRGGELAVRARLPAGLGLRGAASYAWGEAPGLTDPQVRAPLSRVPPPHGFLEASWRHPRGLGASAVLRWAGEQRRLAVADLSDPRIPLGGTPGFALVDLRAWVRVSGLFFSVVVENLLDSPWRAHGSSINGPGRGVLLAVGLGAPGAATPDEGGER